MGRLTFILGGARSGKSTFAERLASQHSERVAYVATAQALDDEMAARIIEHRQKRPESWRTLEIPVNVGQAIRSDPPNAEVIVLDCLTLLVSNLLLMNSDNLEESPERYSDNEHFSVDERLSDAEYKSELEHLSTKYILKTSRVDQEINELQEVIRDSSADWILVSNEVGMGLVPPYPQGRIYRDLLGWANQRMASMADRVYFMVAGIPMRLTPES
jgi:adenosylcobinamide kinase/adenosylcobinamide-phosphate guanylyltransferase